MIIQWIASQVGKILASAFKTKSATQTYENDFKSAPIIVTRYSDDVIFQQASQFSGVPVEIIKEWVIDLGYVEFLV